jgi:hypothetical protein
VCRKILWVVVSLLLAADLASAQMDGFNGAVRNRVELQTQQTIRLDFRLELGVLSETIEARASAPILNTVDAVLGTTRGEMRQIQFGLKLIF